MSFLKCWPLFPKKSMLSLRLKNVVYELFLLSDLFHIQKYLNCRATGGVSIKVRTHFQTNYNLIAIVNTIILKCL